MTGGTSISTERGNIPSVIAQAAGGEGGSSTDENVSVVVLVELGLHSFRLQDMEHGGDGGDTSDVSVGAGGSGGTGYGNGGDGADRINNAGAGTNGGAGGGGSGGGSENVAVRVVV